MVLIGYCFITAKQRRIRFIDDGSRPPDEDEKDTRIKYKAPPGLGALPQRPLGPQSSGVSPLQARMLAMAGQAIPLPVGGGGGEAGGAGGRAVQSETGGDSDDEQEGNEQKGEKKSAEG